MPKSTSRWRQFHTDELRDLLQAMNGLTSEHVIKMRAQIKSELAMRGVPRS